MYQYGEGGHISFGAVPISNGVIIPEMLIFSVTGS